MNGIQFLKQEHETAKGMFRKIEQASPAERQTLWRKLMPELKAHEEIEEACLYGPAASAGQEPKLREWKDHHHQEVRELEGLVRQVDGADASTDAWLGSLRTLRQRLEHHIQEEEGTIWPDIERTWDGAALERAGTEMAAMKREKVGKAA